MQNEPIENDLFRTFGKYNTTVKLTPEDKKAGVKILCHEPYAQELYDLYRMAEGSSSEIGHSKDLQKGNPYWVRAKTISYDSSEIYAEEILSGTNVVIPFKEFSGSLDSLVKDEESREFVAIIYRSTEHGEYYGSERKGIALTLRQDLFNHAKNNTWFSVKILKLIKGGYVAMYKDQVECFVPGSHAAANIVHNFSDLLGKEIMVMVDNYDESNDLFILSYKKYVQYSMPQMITELQFDKEYTGVLTNKPYDFGVFVEIDGYYTGLIHKSEFEDYQTIQRTLKTGDTIPVYVKDVTVKKSQYRIVLTLSQDQINDEKAQWQDLRNRTENKSFPYQVNARKNSISIDIDGDNFEVSLKRKDLEKNLNRYPMVRVYQVDPINKRLNFEFVED